MFACGGSMQCIFINTVDVDVSNLLTYKIHTDEFDHKDKEKSKTKKNIFQMVKL